MNQLNHSRVLAFGALGVAVISLGVSVVSLAGRAELAPTPASTSVSRAAAAPAKLEAVNYVEEARPIVFGTIAAMQQPAEPQRPPAPVNGLTVKRFLVTTGVERREPLIGEAPLLADGKPIFAFAELENQGRDEQQVSVTFERKGSKESVGHATLKVPPNVPRHRTWANTRFIREAGTWEAVLWNANGNELARTSFEVAEKGM